MYYSLERTHCNCHPETCCCDDYVIFLNENNNYIRIASGNEKQELERLVNLANNSFGDTQNLNLEDGRYWSPDGGDLTIKNNIAYWDDGDVTNLNNNYSIRLIKK